jgi:hypothetical protein
MGLDITAYSNLRAVGMHVATGWCEEDGHVTAFAYASFPQSFLGIPIIDQDSQSLYGGCYEVTDGTETFGFDAGPYGGYYRWRLDLAERFNPVELIERSFVEPDPAKPFYELIWFADNEGSIGPTAAAELLADFRAHVDEALPELDDYGAYSNFMRACELAADNGLISFH